MALFRRLAARIDGQPNPVSNGGRPAPATIALSVDGADQRASELAVRLEEIGARMEPLTYMSQNVEALQQRVAALETSVRQAETRAEGTLKRADQIETQRESLQQLVSLAVETLAKIEALKQDGAEIARFEDQLPQLKQECQHLLNQQSSLTDGVERLREVTAALTADTASSRQASQDARECAERATATIVAVEERLDALPQFDAASQDTTAQLQTLNALAERVSSKVKALEHQHQTVEHALVESRRVNEMVWNMDVQIAKLNEGSAVAARVEENLGRLEQLYRDTTAQHEEANRARLTFTEAVDQQRRHATDLLQAVKTQVDHLTLNRSELDTLSERLAAGQSTLAEIERRLGMVSTSEKTVTELGEQISQLGSRLGDLTTRAQTLEQKQAVLSTLEDRLGELEEAAKRTNWQFESMNERRKELDALKREFDAFDSIHGRAQALVEQLRTDRQTFAAFLEEARGFMNGAPAMEAAIAGLKGAVADAEASAARAVGMGPRVDALATDLELLTPRLQIVDDLQHRLDTLHTLSDDIDRKLTAQLGRHAEVESLGVTYTGLITQIADAQQKLATLGAAQARLESVPQQIEQLEALVITNREGLERLRQDEDALAAQERHLTTLNQSARTLAAAVAERLETMHGLQQELAGAGTLKEQLAADVAQIRGMQRDTFAAAQEATDQLRQLADRGRHIDQRSAQLAAVEQTMAEVEGRFNALTRLSEGVEAKLGSIAERERIVDAVRQELDAIYAVARKSQDDLAAIAERRADIAETRSEIDRLSTALAGTSEKIADIEKRSEAVAEVRRKADAVTHLLDDVRVTLDTVSEQKALIDHVSEKLARLDDAIAEARSTTKALQAERKVAERIVDNVRTIHARASADIRKVG